MAFSGGGRGISRLLQSLKRNYCKLTANEDWRGGGESIRILRRPIGGSGRSHCDTTKILRSPSPRPFSSPSCRVALLFRCFGNLKKNQKQQEAKSEKQQAVAQFFNFSADIPPFRGIKFLSMRFSGSLPLSHLWNPGIKTVRSRREKKKSPRIIALAMRRRPDRNPTMALRNTNAYDMIENSRLKIDSKTRTKEKRVKQRNNI